MPRSTSSRRSSALVAFVIAAVVGAAVPAFAQPGRDRLPDPCIGDRSDAPTIELVTMGVGSLVWEKHGHIALCVCGSQPRQDRCYNYGVADFAAPLSMGMSFFRGKPSFWVAATSPAALMYTYVRADRTVWSQRIPLDAEAKKQVIAKLNSDILEENKYYSYDHFWDNCTTRVRDILDDAMDGKLKAIEDDIGDQTIRDYARIGFFGEPALLIITDLFMGRVTDKVPSYWERMYLPEYLRDAFRTKFDVQPRVLYQRKGPPAPRKGSTGRFGFFLLVLLLTAPAIGTALWGRFRRTGLAAALFIPGFFGIVLWTAVVLSPVSYVRWNESFFVFVPLDLALPFLSASLARRYAIARVGILIFMSLLMAVGLFTQPLWVAIFWPLIPMATVVWRPLPGKTAADAPDRDAKADDSDEKPAAKKPKAAGKKKKR